MMTRSRRSSYHKKWYDREVKSGYRLIRKNGNRYNRRMRHCKSDDFYVCRYMQVKTVS